MAALPVPEPVEGGRPYLAGLDGIRAIAVLGVIAYHVGFGWAEGGLLGVGVFFVLSGYLITDLLVAEYRRYRRINLKLFWLRRARRLLPALFLMLFVVVGWATLFDSSQLDSIRSDLLSAMAYFSNWWFIHQHVSYFARFGPPSPLGHLWSLAIEEQFYLLWPLLLLLGFRWGGSRKALVTIILIGAAASATEMGLLYSPLGDPTRAYDGTDTRAFALLIGAALAIAWPRDLRVGRLTPGARRVLEGAGVFALVGILALFAATNEYGAFLYRGGMVLCAVLSAVLIAVTIHPGARLKILLGITPLRWIGARSYGIYLWSYPVIVLSTPVAKGPGAIRAFADVTATFGLAALSWRYLEEPIRHEGLRRLRQWLQRRRHSRTPLTRPGWITASLVGANLIICAIGLSGLIGTAPFGSSPSVSAVLPDDGGPASNSRHADASSSSPSTSQPVTATGVGTTVDSSVPVPTGAGITAIGDSIMIDATPYLRKLLPGITIDAIEGQQLYQVADEAPRLRREGAIGDRLILELGTNGPYSSTQLVDLLRSLGPLQRIVLVNANVDRPWEQQLNQAIAAVAASYPDTSVVNWFALGNAHPDDFYPDDVHLDPQGARYYAGLLAAAIEHPASVKAENH
jgi:peptidoglycan/LPS O-acetylase OafA/YrhL